MKSLTRSTLRLNPKPTPAASSKPPAQSKPKRPRIPVVIEEPILDELLAPLMEAKAHLTAIGREADQLHNTDLPAAITALRGHERCAGLLALLDRVRELRQRQTEAWRRLEFWRRKYERTLGDRECASWRAEP